MERSVAIKKLRNIFGKSFGYRVDPTAPSSDERTAAHEEIKTAVAERNDLEARRQARVEVILAADTEYQSLKADHEAAKKRVQRLMAISTHYKITVGTCGGLFFTVRGQGDSWEDVIQQVSK